MGLWDRESVLRWYCGVTGYNRYGRITESLSSCRAVFIEACLFNRYVFYRIGIKALRYSRFNRISIVFDIFDENNNSALSKHRQISC